jgi:mRNA-degrading endonuclease RelE of RelBE toxin-antitoxin system
VIERVRFTKSAAKDLRKLDQQHAIALVAALESYATTQAGDVLPLKGFRGVFRLRSGDHRACFVIVQDVPLIIEVALIEKRGDAYRKKSRQRLG